MPIRGKNTPKGWKRITVQMANMITSFDGEFYISETDYDRISDGKRLLQSNMFASPETIKQAKALLKCVNWGEKEDGL